MTLTKERLEEIAEDGFLKHGESKELARMALAGMEAEPVYFINRVKHSDAYGDDVELRTYCYELDALKSKDDFGGEIVPVYTAPQPLTTSERAELENYRNAQQVVPEPLAGDIDADDHPLTWSYHNGWNACRAAMLQGAENVESRCSNSPVIPDGWVACSERMPETDWKVLANVKSTAVEYQCLAEVDENGRWWDEYGEQLPSPFVTHWMPLPAAPQQEVKP